MADLPLAFVLGALIVSVLFVVWLERRSFIKSRRSLNSLLAISVFPASIILGLGLLALLQFCVPSRTVRHNLDVGEVQELFGVMLPTEGVSSVTYQQNVWTGDMYYDFEMKPSAFVEWAEREKWQLHEFRFAEDLGFPVADEGELTFRNRYITADGQEIEIKNGLFVAFEDHVDGYDTQILFDRDRSRVFYYCWKK